MVVKIVEFLIFDDETYKLVGRKKYYNMFTILNNTENDKKLIGEFLKTICDKNNYTLEIHQLYNGIPDNIRVIQIDLCTLDYIIFNDYYFEYTNVAGDYFKVFYNSIIELKGVQDKMYDSDVYYLQRMVELVE